MLVQGSGLMRVGNDKRKVAVGELVYIPPNTLHSIENTSNDTLVYVSAATPNVDWQTFYDSGPLRPGKEEDDGQ